MSKPPAIVFRAVLSKEQIRQFLSDFFELEFWHTTKVIIESCREECFKKGTVTLEPTVGGSLARDWLVSSFKNGRLFEWGWSDSFVLIKPLTFSQLPDWATEKLEQANREQVGGEWEQDGQHLKLSGGKVWFCGQLVSSDAEVPVGV